MIRDVSDESGIIYEIVIDCVNKFSSMEKNLKFMSGYFYDFVTRKIHNESRSIFFRIKNLKNVRFDVSNKFDFV